MIHGAFFRLVFHDGIVEQGAYNSFDSTQHWIALAGFQRRFYMGNIAEIYRWDRTHWVCEKGPRLNTVYKGQHYIK